jgi:hypothetical protein
MVGEGPWAGDPGRGTAGQRFGTSGSGLGTLDS